MAEQVEGSPLFRPGWIPVKFRNLWAVEPEDGWLLLYTHPLNRFDLPYRTITGLVDNDRYHDVFTHIPAVWTDPDLVGTLPAGPPIAQCVPIRRQTLELETAEQTPEELRVFLDGIGRASCRERVCQ